MTGTAKTTAYRRLEMLERSGFVEREGRKYRLSWTLFELGIRSSLSWPGGLREIASPWLTYLHVRCGGAVVHLAVLDRLEVLYLDRISSPSSPDVPTAAGIRQPPACTGLGKALLAFSPHRVVQGVVGRGLPSRTPATVTTADALSAQLRIARRVGFAIDDGEAERGLYCVAAPVVQAGLAVGAISVAGSARDLDGRDVMGLVGRVGRRISIDLATGERGSQQSGLERIAR